MAPLLGFFGLPGQMEMLIVAGVALLLFGHRLPGVMRSLGSGIVEFKKGMSDEPEKDPEDGKVENKQST